MLAWYFAPSDGKLAYGDKRPIKKGVIHYVNGSPEICLHGLHGSYYALDALQYAQSSILYRVRLIGYKESQQDKHCAQGRQYLTDGLDITNELRFFARQCALDVIHLWSAPNIVREFLQSGNKTLITTIQDAIWNAIQTAAWNAAQAAEQAAAWNVINPAQTAAWNAAQASLQAAAWNAAQAALQAAAWNVINPAQTAAWNAAQAALQAAAWQAEAWTAASSAIYEKQKNRLEELLNKRLKSEQTT